MLKTPLCIVNFKAYPSAVGLNAVALAKALGRAAAASRVQVALAVQAADIAPVQQACGLRVLAQHVDGAPLGATTGSLAPESAAQAGAVGTLLNHSERRLEPQALAAAIGRARAAGMAVVLCAATPAEAARLAKLKPDFIAIEPPELIGGTVSVSTAKPEVISASTSKIKSVPVLCGAGIKTTDDVAKAVALGAKGILVASGVTNAKDPAAALAALLDGFT